MLTNWRVWNLTTVAAVGGALILGVTAPVRAAVVTYTLKYAELTNDDAVTGCYEFDSSENEKTQAKSTVCANENVIHNLKLKIAPRYAGPGASRLKKPKYRKVVSPVHIPLGRNENHHSTPKQPKWKHDPAWDDQDLEHRATHPIGGPGTPRLYRHDPKDQHHD